MISAKRAACAVLALGIAAAVYAAPSASYTLRYKFKNGQVNQYKMSMNIVAAMAGQSAGAGAPATTGEGTLIMKVQKVNPDGSARIAATAHNFTMRGMGPQGTSGDRTGFFTISPLGALTHVQIPFARMGQSVVGPLVNPDAFATASAVLPARAVKVGDSWTSTRPNVTPGGKPIKVVSRLVGVQQVGGERAARISLKFSIPLNATLRPQQAATAIRLSGALSINGQTLFGIDSGRTIRMDLAGGGPITLAPAGAQAKGGAPMKLMMRIDTRLNLIR